MRGIRRSGLLFAAMWLALAVLVGMALPARAAKFDSPPTISDRKVVLSWKPDSSGTMPDPYYSGNAVLKRQFQRTGLHQAGHAVQAVIFGGGGAKVYSYASGESVIRHWDLATGASAAPDDLPLGGLDLGSLTLHSSDAFLLAALPTPEIAFWRLGASAPHPVLHGVPAPLLAVQFVPAAADTGSVRWLGVASDDSVRVWIRPGGLVEFSGEVTGGATEALAIVPRPASNDYLVAAGTASGTIRIWNSLSLGNSSLVLGFTNPHPAPVLRVAFSPNGQRLVSADAQGNVRLWRLSDQKILGSFQTNQGAPEFAFVPPNGSLLLLGLPDGTVEVRNGLDGSPYIRENLLLHPLSSMALSAGGDLLLVGDADGGVTGMRAGFCKASADQPSCFGGYMVWRSPTPNPEDKVLLRVYTFGDSTWSFDSRFRSFSDPDSVIKRTSIPPPNSDVVAAPVVIAGPHNGVPYYYSVTRFNYEYLSQGTSPVLQSIVEGQDAVFAGFYRDPGSTDPTPVIPRPGARTGFSSSGKSQSLLGEIRVVPNPYEKGKALWELPGEMHVEFQNLPVRAAVQIYTMGGDLVRELRHDLDGYGKDSSVLSWDLKNSSGHWVVSGVYLYQVKAPSGEVEQGYFTVIL